MGRGAWHRLRTKTSAYARVLVDGKRAYPIHAVLSVVVFCKRMPQPTNSGYVVQTGRNYFKVIHTQSICHYPCHEVSKAIAPVVRDHHFRKHSPTAIPYI